MTFKNGWRRFARMWQSDTIAKVDEELQFHFEQKVADLEEQGLSNAQARARAIEEFGDVQLVTSSLREIDGRIVQKRQRAEWWESVVQDLRYVVRSLRRSPVFTATVVATLALGLGANAAIFSLVDHLYLQQPQGVPNPSEIKRVYHEYVTEDKRWLDVVYDHDQIQRLREALPQTVLGAYSFDKRRIGTNVDDPTFVVNFVDGDYFGVVGVRPALGRFFDASERDLSRTELVAVISQQLWRLRFASDSNVIGKFIDVGSHRHTIIGVTSSEFRGIDVNPADVWVPKSTEGTLRGRASDWFLKLAGSIDTRVIARVGPGQSLLAMNASATNVLKEFGKRDGTAITFFGSLNEARLRESDSSDRAIASRLFGVALVILLIACSNVVNLLLARTSIRRREIAMRLALGVSRSRLISQFIVESTVLSLLSGAVALLVALVGTSALRRLLMPDVAWGTGSVDTRVIAFTALLAILVGFVVGLIPAFQWRRPDLSSSLKSSIRDGGGRSNRLRSALLMMQAALSVVLLAGAGVFVRSMNQVLDIDIGYASSQLLFAQVGYDRELENHSQEIAERLPRAAERVRRIAGVQAVGLSEMVPMSGFSGGRLFLPDRDSLPEFGRGLRFRSLVSPEFFSTVGLRAMQGRLLTNDDKFGAEPVIVVDEALARNLWPGENALQKCLIIDARDQPCRRVVGVVSHAHLFDFVEERTPLHYYLPLAQMAPTARVGAIAIRVAPGSVNAIGVIVKRELAAEFGAWSRPNIKIMDEMLAPKLRPWRVSAQLFSAAGILALVVAAVGMYSSIAYTVSQRTQEIGVRVALGASAANIMKLIVRSGVTTVAIGVTIGLALALALGSIIASMLYQTSPRDPLVLIASTLTLLAVAVIASSIPAWRASRVDPLDAMRVE